MNRLFYFVLAFLGIIQSDILWCQVNSPGRDGWGDGQPSDSRRIGGFCGADLLRARSASPTMIAREEKINRILYQLLDRQKKTGRSAQSANDETYVIPVVVHVVHNGGSENISDAQVFAGVQHMNDVFANVGVYDPSTGVSIGIQFCLAKQDTNGIFNTGITRTSSPLTEMTMETQDIALKNLVRWNPRKYMNIWLVREVNSTSSGPGVVGYAYFPSSHGAPEDGIVGEARWFGSSTDNSKIFAHEAGHYLGLYHTFEGGCINNDCLADGDRICDTPPDGTTAPVLCGTPFNSCTTDVDDRSLNNPFRPVADGGLGDQGDLYIDYMDYGRPECYTVFTQGQKDRMRAVLTEIRKSLLESKGCLSPCTSPVIASFTTSSVLVIAGTTVMFTNTSTGASLYEWRVDGAVITTNANASYTFNTQGHYTVALKALNGDPACADIDSITIEVTCPVRASFSADRQTALSGQTVTFTNTATGATTYEWLLDGVLIGTSQDLQHIFGTDGGYQVILIASNGICRDTSLAMLIRVGGCSPPKEWNIWYFGNGAGIDFNSGTPTGITDGVLFSREGVASICDRDGNLLCYSDGLDLPR